MTVFYILVVILLNGGGQVLPFHNIEDCIRTGELLYLEVVSEVKCYKVSGNFDIKDYNFNHDSSFAPKTSPVPVPKSGNTI